MLIKEKKKQNASFKPYYKWNTFNTNLTSRLNSEVNAVLNLIINGIPSILEVFKMKEQLALMVGFKPYYKWNTFNTQGLDRELASEIAKF